ncbi:MAG: hypothetical protein CYPHOPRED_004307 [Cyphobasidiales sp. Tagirdzhanova-0007]|nr:MAG: hypothetical protein CYPHOPRED_004307 [Cyphobasidiales sp. Tagirdzhanova-0007]
MVYTCPSTNTEDIQQEAFFSAPFPAAAALVGVARVELSLLFTPFFADGRWDQHKIGWLIAGLAAFFATMITLSSSYGHALNYHKPKEQRQIIRILWMPMVYAIINFFSYRFFLTVYESFVLMAFLALMLAYVGESSDQQMDVMKEKDKRGLPFPFGCIRFRPSKPYFLHALNASVLQYAFLRPLISIIGSICEAFDILCPQIYSPHFAEVYLDALDFVSISVALYGLIVFYTLVKERLAGQKPLAKFLCIKLIVMFTFYQDFVFDALVSHGYIKATEYWTTTNIANGLNALCTCCEMILFALLMAWAYPSREYHGLKDQKEKRTNPLRAMLNALNFWDFVEDIWVALLFTRAYIKHEPGTHAKDVKADNPGQQFDIHGAFNRTRPGDRRLSDREQLYNGEPYGSTAQYPTDLELAHMQGRQELLEKQQGRQLHARQVSGDGNMRDSTARAPSHYGYPEED